MGERLTPREMVKGMLQGVAPARPLWVPIVFSLGARVENVPLRAFLSNPTKIANSLRQIRGHLRSDGVACYFDPSLELEALGGALEWKADDQLPAVRWSGAAAKGELPEGLHSPEEAAKNSRISIAVETIRRLKAMLRDGPLLMAGVAGPATLAARLTQLADEDGLRFENLPEDALGTAAAMTRQVAAAFAEAGANFIFIQEEILPGLSPKTCEAWASLLAPACNIIRFYEALPVLQLTSSRAFAKSGNVILGREWECVLCPTLEARSSQPTEKFSGSTNAMFGLGLPLTAFEGDESRAEEFEHRLHGVIADLHPALLTTAGDVPAGVDMKRMTRIMGNLSGHHTVQ